MLKAFLRDSAIYSVPALFGRGLALLLIPLYTRVLSPGDYGALDLLLVFASLAQLTVGLEITQGVARFYATEKDPDRQVAYASTAFWFTIGCYTVFALPLLWYATDLQPFIMGRDGLLGSFRVGVVYIWLQGNWYFAQNQLRWEMRSVHYAVASVLALVFTAAVALLLTYGFDMGLVGLLWGMAAGAALGWLYALASLRHSFRLRFTGARLREMLRFSAPLVPSGLAVFAGLYVDRLMIAHFMTLHDVGIYGVGYRIATIAGLTTVGFQSALTPLVYRHHDADSAPADLARIFRGFLAVALTFFATLSLFAEPLLRLLTTPEYAAAAPLVAFLVPAVLLSQMYIFAPGMAIAQRTGLILRINLAGAAINVVLNWLLIPRFGTSGAAAATLIGHGVGFAAAMLLSQRLYRAPHRWRAMLAATAAVSLIVMLVDVDTATLAGALLAALALIGVMAAIAVAGLLRPAELVRIAGLGRTLISSGRTDHAARRVT